MLVLQKILFQDHVEVHFKRVCRVEKEFRMTQMQMQWSKQLSIKRKYLHDEFNVSKNIKICIQTKLIVNYSILYCFGITYLLLKQIYHK